jgi:hypothetical protein
VHNRPPQEELSGLACGAVRDMPSAFAAMRVGARSDPTNVRLFACPGFDRTDGPQRDLLCMVVPCRDVCLLALCQISAASFLSPPTFSQTTTYLPRMDPGSDRNRFEEIVAEIVDTFGLRLFEAGGIAQREDHIVNRRPSPQLWPRLDRPAYSNDVSPDRNTRRTVFRDTPRSRAISSIVLPLTKCSRRIRATVSTTSIH